MTDEKKVLYVRDDQKICEDYCDDADQFFHAGNGQTIREKLLRQACKSCDFYATDVLILLDENGEAMKELHSGDVSEVDIYFEQSGLEWATFIDGQFQRVTGGEFTKHYRHAMKLRREKHPSRRGSVYILYSVVGNV